MVAKRNYSILARLGQGAHGSVLKARNLENNRVVALKQIPLKEEINSQLRLYREVQSLRQCNHENIIKLLDVLFPEEDDDAHSPQIVSLVLEFVESNLKLVIEDTRRPLNDVIPRFYFTQIFYGISYLHQIGIMHRDLKPDNILISVKNHVRIADFGLACIFFPNEPEKSYEHQVATRWYRAPELLFGSSKYTPSVDIWAIGCILAEFFNGIPFFAGSTDIEQLVKIFHVLGTPSEQSWPGWELLPDAGKVLFDPTEPIEDWPSLVPLASSTECLPLIRAMLQLNPAKRPSALHCLLDADFFSAYPIYESIHGMYKPPLLEEHLEKRPPEIVFRMVEQGED